jgi:multidrug efflux system membrane fusion protein
VRVLAREQKDVLTVPSAAIQHGPDGVFTYVVKPDSTVEARPLTVGEETEGMMVVSKGLAAGERVVISNQYRLEPGVHVRELKAQAQAPTSASGAPAQIALRSVP